MTIHSTICTTKRLNPSVKEFFHESGIDVHEAEQFEIEYRQDQETRLKIESQYGAIVATSRHGIEGIISNIPDRKLKSTGLFCLSGATELAARRLDVPVIATAENARLLAAKIIEAGVSYVTYFCGEVHRPELTTLLNERGIKVNEVVVYSAIARGEKITKPFDHVLFFSPRSAKIFLRNNALPARAVCFCIGETTAAYLRENTRNRVVTSPHPTQADLAKTAVEFLNKHLAQQTTNRQ